jgi:hypothetical protein
MRSEARAAQNSMRHGLSRSIVFTAETSAKLERLALALAGSRRDPGALEQARIAAEAELELQRVRAYRQSVLEKKTRPTNLWCQPVRVGHRGSLARSGVRHEVADVSGAVPQLSMLERYERRALSRRKRAMRWLMYTELLFRQDLKS